LKGLNPYLGDSLPDEEKTGNKGGDNAIGTSPNTTALGCTCPSAERLENSWGRHLAARGNNIFGTKKSGAMIVTVVPTVNPARTAVMDLIEFSRHRSDYGRSA
jgi:hypothetical protein